MKHASCAALVFLVFALGDRAHAQFGSDEDASRAARENAEPAYIADFMRFVSDRLTRFAHRANITTPHQRLALLNALEILLRLAHVDALNAAQEAAAEANTPFIPPELYDETGRAALEVGLGVAHIALHDAVRAAWPRGRSVTGDATHGQRRERRNSRNRSDELRNAARVLGHAEALTQVERSAAEGASIVELGRVAYRVAERAVLNGFANDFDWRLNVIYRTEIQRIPEHFGNDNPLVDVTVWPVFHATHFEGLSPAAMAFLTPIGELLSAWMQVTGALQFQMARHRVESPVSILPAEIVMFILTLVAPQAYVRRAPLASVLK